MTGCKIQIRTAEHKLQFCETKNNMWGNNIVHSSIIQWYVCFTSDIINKILLWSLFKSALLFHCSGEMLLADHISLRITHCYQRKTRPVRASSSNHMDQFWDEKGHVSLCQYLDRNLALYEFSFEGLDLFEQLFLLVLEKKKFWNTLKVGFSILGYGRLRA